MDRLPDTLEIYDGVDPEPCVVPIELFINRRAVDKINEIVDYINSLEGDC